MAEEAAKRKPKANAQYCCVVGCHNNSKNAQKKEPPVKFYRFPGKWYQEEQRKAWINAVRRVNPDGTAWQPKEWSRICSNHFVDGCKSDKSDHPSYIPTIFPPEYRKSARDPEKVERGAKRADQATSSKGHTGVATNLPQSSSDAVPVQTPDTPNDEQHKTGADDTFPKLDAGQPSLSASAIDKTLQGADVACQTEDYSLHGKLTFFLTAITGVNASTQVTHVEQSDKATTTDGSWKRKREFSGSSSLKENEQVTQRTCGDRKLFRTVSGGVLE